MNEVTEAKQIFQHIQSAINETIKNEVMSLSIRELINFITEYKSMKYKPSTIYVQMAETAQEELLFREARLHRELITQAKAGS